VTPGLTLYSQGVVLPTQDLQEGLIPSHCVGEDAVSLVLKYYDGGKAGKAVPLIYACDRGCTRLLSVCLCVVV